MLKHICLLLFTFCLLSPTFSQRKLEKDIKSLHQIINNVLKKSDRYHESRKSEFVLMILEVDSNATISSIHLLADKKNTDTTFSILEKMNPGTFAGNKFYQCKNKTVGLPVYSLAGLDTDNPGKTAQSYVLKSIIHYSTAHQSSHSVVIRPLYYLPPGEIVKRESLVELFR